MIRASRGASARPAGALAVAGLALGPVVALGFSRFAYALLLPPMRDSLHWSYATAGLMNSANAAGYLAGAIATGAIARHLGVRRAFLISFAVGVVSLFAMAASGATAFLLLVRAVSGVAGAVTFITGAGLAVEILAASTPGKAAAVLGLFFAGGGAGIVLSGLAIGPLLGSVGGAGDWRLGWMVLGGMGMVSLLAAAPAALVAKDPPPRPEAGRRWPAHRMLPLVVSYGLFGIGYIAYMTFVVAFLKGEGVDSGEIGLFWLVLGLLSIGSTFAWARPISRLRGGGGVSLVLGVLTVGALLPLLSRSPWVVMSSAVLFGASFLSVVTAVTAVARRLLDRHFWTPAIGGLTVVFAIGQCLGPVLSGVLSTGPSGLRVGLALSPLVLAAASLVALAQRDHRVELSGSR